MPKATTADHMRRLCLFLLVCAALSLSQCAVPSSPTVSLPALTGTPLPSAPTLTADPYLEARLEMVQGQIERRGIADEDVLRAMRAVPRHQFVPEEWVGQAYEDHPLPIGYGQTISQPFMVAWMTELLQVDSSDRVLEIGTGSGYQAAVLGELGVETYTVEIIEPLATQAGERLAKMGYDNVAVSHGDGYYGWEEHAPYDAIIVTAAPDHIPPPLIAQLEDPGRMVVPVGPPGGYQSLFLVLKEDGVVRTENLGGVNFVPFTREDDRR
jgi:protein-L-isoaspartate(D-aspartate) O-methyltransferase